MKKLLQLVFMMAIMGISTLTAQDLVINGDLESWTAGDPDGWTVMENISQESTTIHGGSYSAAHMSEITTKDFQQVLINVEGGQEYNISYWYYDNDPAARTRIWSYWMESGTTLSDNGEELRPSTYSEDNASWIQYNVTLVAPATANEFRFEVRVYKQDEVAGGSVYYDDFVFSGDVTINPEPSEYPTGFSATASGTSIDLNWTDATGAQLPLAYIIMAGTSATLPVPVDGTPVSNDPDLSDGSGAINVSFGAETASFGSLDPNTTYYFTIYPYTNSAANIDFKSDGTAPAANATTANVVTLEFENFDESWGNWTTFSVIGDEVWDRDNTYGINSTPCAQMSGYNGGALDNEDWLISPALDLDENENETLEFFTAMNYTGPDMECLISTDYSGTGDPNVATWTALSYIPSPGNWDWTSSGIIDISTYSGAAVYVGFKFTSTTAGSATWEVEDVNIIAGGGTSTPDPEPSNYPTAFTANEAGTAIDLAWADAIGSQLPAGYIIYASVNATLPVPDDGTPVADDTDLSDGSGALNVGFGLQQATFSSLDTGTTYYFSIYSYTNNGSDIDFKTDGVAPTANATTSNTAPVIIEEENFDDSWGNWTTISVIGDEVWDRDNEYGVGGSPCAQMSGYSGAPFNNEDWLISPALNFNDYENENLVFYTAMAYTGPDMECKISTDYSGTGDPNVANWDNLTFTFSTEFFEWTASGDIDISGYDGEAVYVAFMFTSTEAGSATWEVDDITISGDIDSRVNESLIGPAVQVYPNPATETIYLQQSGMDYTSVSLRSIDGRLVSGAKLNTTTAQLNISELNAGIYFLTFSHEKTGISRTQKVIVR